MITHKVGKGKRTTHVSTLPKCRCGHVAESIMKPHCGHDLDDAHLLGRNECLVIGCDCPNYIPRSPSATRTH